MFRCITGVKGIVIDIDSFHNTDVYEWKEIVSNYKCVFMTSSNENENAVKAAFESKAFVQKIEGFIRYCAPNVATHKKSKDLLSLNTTEIVYVSSDISHLRNAMSILSGTVWITEEIDYKDASNSPDLICSSISSFSSLLKKDVRGFLGEVAIFPNADHSGMVIPVKMEIEENADIPLYMLGRYFSYSHYMSQLHPYSSAICLNKREGKPYFRKFDDKFSSLYITAVKSIQRTEQIDMVCSVPVRPSKINRFDTILKSIAKECNIENIGSKVSCIKEYQTQKNLNQVERAENIKGVFDCSINLEGKSVVIIDDIISTGATLRECIKVLYSKGAEQVVAVVLGINQFDGSSYWSSIIPEVKCPKCDSKMHLLINRYSNFFYSCYECGATLQFEEGRNMLVDSVNHENPPV